MQKAPHTFTWPIRVYIEDTDVGGVVYYANYLKFFERARTEWLRMLSISQADLIGQHDAIFVVSGASIDYRAPARLDDEIRIASRVDRLGRVSIRFVQEAWRDDVLLASATVSVACVAFDSLRPKPIPESVRIKMQTVS